MAPVSNGKNAAPENVSVQGPDAPLAHRRPGYSSSGCTPAEPDSASPGNGDFTLAKKETQRTGESPEVTRSRVPRFTPRSRAGLRLHPGVRHGALRRRRCEWEQPHTLSWRSAFADDAEWMSGKSRDRLALVLTEASSWMSDRRTLRSSACARRSMGPKHRREFT